MPVKKKFSRIISVFVFGGRLKFFFISYNYVGVRDTLGQWHCGSLMLYLFQKMYHFA